jgi:hypothetical protein
LTLCLFILFLSSAKQVCPSGTGWIQATQQREFPQNASDATNPKRHTNR